MTERSARIRLCADCTLKNGPIICTVVSSSAGVATVCSGSLIILPVTL